MVSSIEPKGYTDVPCTDEFANPNLVSVSTIEPMIYTDAPTDIALILVSNIEQKCYTDVPCTNVLDYPNLSIVSIIEPMCYTGALDNISLTMVSSIEPKHYLGASSDQESIPPLFPLLETLLTFPFHCVTGVGFTFHPQLYTNPST